MCTKIQANGNDVNPTGTGRSYSGQLHHDLVCTFGVASSDVIHNLVTAHWYLSWLLSWLPLEYLGTICPQWVLVIPMSKIFFFIISWPYSFQASISKSPLCLFNCWCQSLKYNRQWQFAQRKGMTTVQLFAIFVKHRLTVWPSTFTMSQTSKAHSEALCCQVFFTLNRDKKASIKSQQGIKPQTRTYWPPWSHWPPIAAEFNRDSKCFINGEKKMVVDAPCFCLISGYL